MGYGYRNTVNDFIADESDASSFMGSNPFKTRRRKTKKSRRTTRAKSTRRKRRVTHRRIKRAKSTRRVHKTKNGQPYIILASGKARFIKRKR